MRTLIVNSMFANAGYRRCADELGALPGIDLSMLTVDAWIMNGPPMPFEPIQVGAPYATFIGNACWRGKENRGFYCSNLINAFRVTRPDILFLMEEPFSVFAAEILLLKKLIASRIPVVFFTWNNLSLTEFDYRPSIFYRNVARWALPQMHYALTANTDGHQVLRNVGFDRPIKTIGYGVDSEAYIHPKVEEVRSLKQSLNIDDGDIVIGYVGRLLEMKGIDLLIRAFAELRKKRSNLPLKLLLVGSGEEHGRLLRLAEEEGITPLLRHVPSVAHNEVPNYMHAIDILVLPSRRRAMWAEQFGRVLVEAMAAGKIVIGSSSGAIPEVIGDAGFVFSENDYQALTASLEHALQFNEEQRNSLRVAAQDRANFFSWKRFAEDAANVLEYTYTHYSVKTS